MTLQSHGIGLESEVAEVTTDAGQPQVMKKMRNNALGLLTE